MGSTERMLLALRTEEGTESSGMWGPQFETGPREEGLDRMGAWACSALNTWRLIPVRVAPWKKGGDPAIQQFLG